MSYYSLHTKKLEWHLKEGMHNVKWFVTDMMITEKYIIAFPFLQVEILPTLPNSSYPIYKGSSIYFVMSLGNLPFI